MARCRRIFLENGIKNIKKLATPPPDFGHPPDCLTPWIFEKIHTHPPQKWVLDFAYPPPPGLQNFRKKVFFCDIFANVSENYYFMCIFICFYY